MFIVWSIILLSASFIHTDVLVGEGGGEGSKGVGCVEDIA